MNEEEYKVALEELDILWPIADTRVDEFNKLADAIEKYEAEHFPISPPTLWGRVEFFFGSLRWWSPRVWLRYWWR